VKPLKFQSLKGAPESLPTIVWSCDPLVVTDEEDRVIYAEMTDVEFNPDDRSAMSGLATALTRNAEGEEPVLKVRQRFNETNSIQPYPSRGGFTLIGEDLAGNIRTWYVDRAADKFLAKY
jgi:hypothetical protein